MSKATNRDLKEGLRKLFRQYDADGNGHIDQNELWAMLIEVTIAGGGKGKSSSNFSEEDAESVMASLDEDGNGTVEEDEMVDWVISGLARPDEERQAFAQSGELAMRLDNFLTACGKLGERFSKLKSAPADNSARKSAVIPVQTKAPEKKQVNSALRAITAASSDITGACDLLQLQAGLRVLFLQFSSMKQGLDVEAVKLFFRILPKQYSRIENICTPDEKTEIAQSLPNICTDGDAQRVFNALDTDQSGFIDMDEWIQWFVAGSLRDPQKQMAFASKSAFNLRLTHLLRVVVCISQKLLPQGLVTKFCDNVMQLYNRALAPGMSALPEDRMSALMEMIKTKMSNFACHFTGEDAKKIHRALDNDGDAVVTESEWTSWILRGVSLSFSERKRFSEKSSINLRMTSFLESVCVVCGGFDLLHGMILTPHERVVSKLSKEALSAGLKLLFDQFDTDASGCIDESELRAMMIDLPIRFYVNPNDVPTQNDVGLVMEALDQDNNGEVDFEEWKKWILGNRSMSEERRAKFVAMSESHARLDRFVGTLVQITSEMMAPLGGAEELRPGLVEIFNMCCVEDKVGAEQIHFMVMKLTAKHPEAKWFECTKVMARTITEALDADGNGTVELEEWVTWIIRGAQRPALERAQFAAHSETFMLLTKFLEAVSFVAKKLTLFAGTR